MNHFTVYKITNLVNGKYYIGKHQTKDLDDGYFGSGKLIRKAIKKYGIENFKKEILFVFETEDEMNAKEAELVTEDLIASGSVYNLCPGGQGGFGYINENVLTKEDRIRIGSIGGKLIINRHPMSDEIREIGRSTISKKYPKSPFYNKAHTEETKAKMSEKAKIHSKGVKNSQFGTMWITNGTENKKIKKDLDIIPEGWYKGRT